MIYAYLRVSREEQDYRSQKVGIDRYCEYKGLKIDREVVEEGVSGKIPYKERKLNDIIKKAKKGDTIIVAELSRLSRQMTECFEMAKILTDKGVNVYCIKENLEINNTALGLMVMSLFAFSAQIERERIVERTKEGIERARREGKQIGRPFGFTYRKLNVDEVKMYLDGGLNKKQTAKALNCSRGTLYRFIKENNIDDSGDLDKLGVNNG
jgi:DNA invertase Pin-like site-specific DNA recombinase